MVSLALLVGLHVCAPPEPASIEACASNLIGAGGRHPRLPRGSTALGNRQPRADSEAANQCAPAAQPPGLKIASGRWPCGSIWPADVRGAAGSSASNSLREATGLVPARFHGLRAATVGRIGTVSNRVGHRESNEQEPLLLVRIGVGGDGDGGARPPPPPVFRLARHAAARRKRRRNQYLNLCKPVAARVCSGCKFSPDHVAV